MVDPPSLGDRYYCHHPGPFEAVEEEGWVQYHHQQAGGQSIDLGCKGNKFCCYHKHLQADECSSLPSAPQELMLSGMPTDTIAGLRDRALIGTMVYTFGRVSAVLNMQVRDYFQSGKRWCFRLHEKGGKYHEVPAHHNAEAYVDAYLEAAGIGGELKTPLFRSIDRYRQLTERPLHRCDVLAMIKRRARQAGLPATTCCHTFRATGITAYRKNGGTLERLLATLPHRPRACMTARTMNRPWMKSSGL